jgi:hypothetical protein
VWYGYSWSDFTGKMAYVVRVSQVTKYHTIREVTKYHTIREVTKYHTIREVTKPKRIIVETDVKSDQGYPYQIRHLSCKIIL